MMGKIYMSKFGKNIYPLFKIFKPKKVMTKNGFVMNIHKDRDWISDKIILKKEWDSSKEKLFKKFVNPGDCVADIGANIGYHTLTLSRLVGKLGKVYSFEPETDNFRLLQKNIKENNVKNVDMIKMGISNKKDNVKLNFGEKTHGGGTILNYQINYGFEIIKTITLDDFFKGKKIDFLKLDIEWAELKAFEGGKKTLKKVKGIITEFMPDSLISVGINPLKFIEILEKGGFNLYAIDEKNLKLIPFNLKTFEEKHSSNKSIFLDILCLKKKLKLEY